MRATAPSACRNDRLSTAFQLGHDPRYRHGRAWPETNTFYTRECRGFSKIHPSYPRGVGRHVRRAGPSRIVIDYLVALRHPAIRAVASYASSTTAISPRRL